MDSELAAVVRFAFTFCVQWGVSAQVRLGDHCPQLRCRKVVIVRRHERLDTNCEGTKKADWRESISVFPGSKLLRLFLDLYL